MRKLTTGDASTLGNWLALTRATLGENSPAATFLQKKIDAAANGEQEEVIADESQLLRVLMQIHLGQVRP